MMNSWNTVIFMKSKKPWMELRPMAKWEGVESMWSTTGDWDWCIKLDKKSSSPEMAQEFVARMRDGNWASETQTNWWKEISA